METSELRKFLRFAKAEPVNIAMALDGGGKAILVCHKRRQPRALEKELKEEEGSKMHRFGTLTVDPLQPKLARFVINRAGAGLARKLIKTLKGTGFNRVEIVLEDGTPVEGDQGEEEEEEEQYQEDMKGQHGDEEDEEGEEDQEGGGKAGQTRNPEIEQEQPAQAQAYPEQPAGQDPPAGYPAGDQQPGPDPNQPDPAALAKELTQLVRQMMKVIASDPSQKAGLAELATDAQASLKRGDLEQAAAGIDIFRQAMGGTSDTTPQPPAGGEDATAPADVEAAAPQEDAPDQSAQTYESESAPSEQEEGEQGEGQDGAEEDAHVKRRRRQMGKSLSAWTATRARIDKDLEKLRKQIEASHDDNEFGDDLSDSLTEALQPVLESLDEGLERILAQAAKAKRREEHEKLQQEAMEAIKRLTASLQNHPVILHVDANPFVPMQLGKTLTATLQTLGGIMH